VFDSGSSKYVSLNDSNTRRRMEKSSNGASPGN
jgi:hypothetical protein